jgi:hypothetical protein
MVMECSEPDESVIAFYLLKVLKLNLNFDTVTKEDVKFMCLSYSGRMPVSSCSAEDYFANRQQEEVMTASVGYGHNFHRQQTPTICYRCHKPGHIARGCREFRCFRCQEVGHIRAGCRKRMWRPDAASSPVATPTCPETTQRVKESDSYVSGRTEEVTAEDMDEDCSCSATSVTEQIGRAHV